MSGTPGGVAVLDLEPATSEFLAEAIAGLSSTPPTLPSKFFYDERGSDLFLQICEQPEYYITRTERAILSDFDVTNPDQLQTARNLLDPLKASAAE